jgi:hypothetical protein
MMKKNIMVSVAICLAIFLAAPYIPTSVINLISGNYIAVFIILGLNLFLLRIDALLSLTFFLAAGSLFLEYRKRMLATIEKAVIEIGIDGITAAPVAALSVPAEDLIDGEVHPEHESPSSEEYTFEPTKETQSNSFYKVGISIDEKQVLKSEDTDSAAEMAERFIKSGYA